MAAMWYVTLVKFRRPPTKQDTERMNTKIKEWAAKGVKVHNAFYTMGRFDQVWVWEAPDDKVAAQTLMDSASDAQSTETMPAMDREEVHRWSM